MFYIKVYYGFFTTIISLIIFINTFIRKESKMINKFPKNKKIVIFIHSFIFYFIILLHFLNVYFNIFIYKSLFIIIYILGIISILIGSILGNYALLDGPTVYINYLQIIYIFILRFAINIYNIIYINDFSLDDKISTLIMLNSQPLTRFFVYFIKKCFKQIKNEKEKGKISIPIAQSIIVTGTAPIIFEKYQSIISILILISFLIFCSLFNFIIYFKNKMLSFYKIK